MHCDREEEEEKALNVLERKAINMSLYRYHCIFTTIYIQFVILKLCLPSFAISASFTSQLLSYMV